MAGVPNIGDAGSISTELEGLLAQHMQALQHSLNTYQRLYASVTREGLHCPAQGQQTPLAVSSPLSVSASPIRASPAWEVAEVKPDSAAVSSSTEKPLGHTEAWALPGSMDSAGDHSDVEVFAPPAAPLALSSTKPPSESAPLLDAPDVFGSDGQQMLSVVPSQEPDHSASSKAFSNRHSLDPSDIDGDVAGPSEGPKKRNQSVRAEAFGKSNMSECSTAEKVDTQEVQPCRPTVTQKVGKVFGKVGDSSVKDFLTKVQLFKRLPKEAYEDLCSCCEEVEFAKNSCIMRQGDIGHEFFLLMFGRVSIVIDGNKVAILQPGDYFGETALLKNEPRTATVMAETGVKCLRIKRDDFQALGLHDKIAIPQRQTVAAHHKAVFADANAMKEKLRAQMAKPPYDVRNLYHETGLAQKIARSQIFETITLAVIAFNAIWISVDTDHNDADLLIHAHPVFIAAENAFCLYFSFEWLTRFLSFRRKQDGLKDSWFLFDSCLVGTMVGETWVLNAITLATNGGGDDDSSSGGDASILRLFRLLRLSRMARMARLLRAMPEVMVMLKGMLLAMRSVFFTLLILIGIVYVFAISFVQLLAGTGAGDAYFPTVPDAMNSLLFNGVLPDQAQFVEDVGEEGAAYKILVSIYILLALITVMNMLVGVLCEVVSVVSSVEKESLLVNYVKGTLLNMLQTSGLDADGDNLINKHEFEALLENPIAAKALSEVGVDVIGLVDFTDFIFKDGRELSFPDFMEMVLQLRGSNVATVKDLVDLRKLMMSELERINSSQKEVTQEVTLMMRNHQQQNANSGWADLGGDFMQGSISLGQGPFSPKDMPNAQHLTWAAAASFRLTEAATQLSAAAGEISSRNERKHKAAQALQN